LEHVQPQRLYLLIAIPQIIEEGKQQLLGLTVYSRKRFGRVPEQCQE